MVGGRDGIGIPGGNIGRGTFGGNEGNRVFGGIVGKGTIGGGTDDDMPGGGAGRGTFGGGNGGGRPESIITGIEVRARIDGLFGLMMGSGGAVASVVGPFGSSLSCTTVSVGQVTAALTSDALGVPICRLGLRAGMTLWKKSLEGVAPAKYEFEAPTGGDGFVVMLVRLCDRNGAGSERICTLAGRRRPLPGAVA